MNRVRQAGCRWLVAAGREERGSISVWAAMSAIVMMICVGIALDLGAQVHAQQHARGVAAQAARVGGQQLDAAAVTGAYPSLAVGHARVAAQAYLEASGVEGTVTVTGGDTVHVSVTDTYDPRFLGIVGISNVTVTGEATARVIRTLGEREQ